MDRLRAAGALHWIHKMGPPTNAAYEPYDPASASEASLKQQTWTASAAPPTYCPYAPFLYQEWKLAIRTYQTVKGCGNGFPFLQPLILYYIYIVQCQYAITCPLLPALPSAGRRDSDDTIFRKSSAACHLWRASPGPLRFHLPASVHSYSR